jgi:3' terminal RNA ribose 2'-O-methyltransferase Hen1
VFLSITYRGPSAADLGYLLHKHPDRFQEFSLTVGKAHVFFPHVSPDACTAALVLDIDPLELAKRRRLHRSAFALEPYVNDRPYVASSFLSVAIAQIFGSALGGRSQDRPELAATPLQLEATVAALPEESDELIRRLFEPLGYQVQIERPPLDARFSDWGPAPSCVLRLSGVQRLADLLNHLYVLLPVLDDAKHYWVDEAEIEKLQRHGGAWIPAHPEKDLIVNRYLRHRRHLTSKAIASFAGPEDAVVVPALDDEVEDGKVLWEQRMDAVQAALHEANARRILDLGCGEGRLLERLVKDRAFTQIVGVEVSWTALRRASDRLQLERLPPELKGRIQLLHGSLVYRDERLRGYDAAALVEVIEHVDPPRLCVLEQVVFGHAKPQTVVVTTPNLEANQALGVPAGEMRHEDHRFEWTRQEFTDWANRVAAGFGYAVEIRGVGPDFGDVGHASQMGVFRRQ